MTRTDLVQQLAAQLGDVPVATSFDAVIPPAVVVSSTGPYRVRNTACWGTTWQLLVIGGQADAVDIETTLDGLADRICGLRLPNVVNEGATDAPTVVAIGDVDYLTCTFTLADHNAGG